MLSIIISTKEEDKFNEVKDNVNKTIGKTTYEIIKIFNKGEINLSEAYNQGAASSKFENLLFLHDDVQFLTQDWGRILLNTLELEDAGVVGLAGGTKKFKLPTGHDSGIGEYRFVSVIHHRKEKIKKEIIEPVRVKTLDGVFLALRKERWQEFKFNEKLEGFHFYDLDISLRISENFQNYIVPGICLQHFSMGNFNDSWIEASLRFHKNNYNFDSINRRQKGIVRKFWFKRLLKEKISAKNRMRYINAMGVDKSSWKQALKFLIAK